MDKEVATTGISRRNLIKVTGGTTAILTSGCVQRTRSMLGRRQGDQIELSIKTVPADETQAATEIARSLANNLTKVGIDAKVVLMQEEELRRDVLINHDFDIYVARYPDHRDPDFLRPLLHSQFSGELGWQNPFGFTNITIDELLDTQRQQESSVRRATVRDILRRYAEYQPFAMIGFQDEIRAVRTDRYEGWREYSLNSPLGYLGLRAASDTATESTNAPSQQSRQLRVTTTDERITKNLNPIAVEFRDQGTFTGLIYEPLARRFDGTIRPWLADDWHWETEDETTIAVAKLRENLEWHDGTHLTASDVVFTYRFLADTALGDRTTPVPAPRFRGRISLVDAIQATDSRTIRFSFGDNSRAVAVRALTIPILPAHEWEPKATEAEIAGLRLFEGVTEGLIWENPRPIGSGPLQFDRRVKNEQVVLSRYDNHFFNQDPPPAIKQRFTGPLPYDELVIRVVPSDTAAVELVAGNDADATASNLDSSVVPHIGRSEALDLVVDPSNSFYHVGFNVRAGVLGNQIFRRAITRLLDIQTITNSVFDGFFRPTAVPVSEPDLIPSDLRWGGDHPSLPFLGTAGELDVAAARAEFRDAGYHYNSDGELVT